MRLWSKTAWWKIWCSLWICASSFCFPELWLLSPRLSRASWSQKPGTARQLRCGKSSQISGRGTDEHNDEKRSYFSLTTRISWSHRTLINSSCRFVILQCLSVNDLIVDASSDIRHGADRVSSHRRCIDSMSSNAATSILIQRLNIKVCQNESWQTRGKKEAIFQSNSRFFSSTFGVWALQL